MVVFCLVGGYLLYAATHAAGSPEMMLEHSHLCLDDFRNLTANNSVVDVWTCNGSAAQHWVMSGKRVTVNGKCLDAQGFGTANGTKVNLYTCNGGTNQQWTRKGTGAWTELVNVHAGKCLDDPAFGGKGTRLELFTCNGGQNQLWQPTFYTPTVSPTPAPSASQTPTPSPSPTATPSHTPTPTPTGTPKPTSTPSPSPKPVSNVSCNYQTDTWSGDASSVGYSVSKLSSKDGNPASFSVKLNANPGTTEVVGYPSDQCIMYSTLPSNLVSSFSVTPPASSSGLDYEFAYDVWLTTAAKATANNWDGDLELMIWTYNHGQTPAGSVKATLADGSKVWVDGNNTTGTVSVVLPQNETAGSVNITSITNQLKNLGYVVSGYNGILDVEYGIEAPYGGGQTFTVNSMSVSE